MSENGISPERVRRRGAVHLSELIGQALKPLAGKRGFARADLVAAWPGIVGARYANCTRPEKIACPKGVDTAGKPGVLIVRVDGPRAILFQHEAGQVVERVNAFLGYAGVGQVRIVQGQVNANAEPETLRPRHLEPAEEAKLSGSLQAVADDGLRSALAKLGRGVLSEKPR